LANSRHACLLITVEEPGITASEERACSPQGILLSHRGVRHVMVILPSLVGVSHVRLVLLFPFDVGYLRLGLLGLAGDVRLLRGIVSAFVNGAWRGPFWCVHW
jgi:hypothetical protein